MKTRLAFVLTLALCAFAFASSAAAAPRKSKFKPPEVHATTIASVNGETLTINENKISKTFTITPFTEITINGQRAKLTDLQSGMIVSVTMGSDPTKLARVSASAASPSPAH